MGMLSRLPTMRTTMNRLLLAALLLAPLAAAAQPAPEMVLLPRQVAEAARDWIATPNAGNAVQLYALLSACLDDNPKDGRLVRMGADRCQPVTDAIAARDKEIADLKKQLDDAKKPPAPETHAP